jgi:hypothetical protein
VEIFEGIFGDWGVGGWIYCSDTICGVGTGLWMLMRYECCRDSIQLQHHATGRSTSSRLGREEGEGVLYGVDYIRSVLHWTTSTA